MLTSSKKPAEQLHVAGLSYDIETTGIGPTAEIVQIAVHTANSAQASPPEFNEYVLPSGRISDGATEVHGLTRESLEAAGAKPFDEVWPQLEAWIQATFGSGRPLVWCAHNGQSFDHPILLRECRAKCGKDLHGDEYARFRFMDTLPLARRVLPGRSGPGSYTLGRLHADATMGGGIADAHDALADARALSTVWRWLATTSLPPATDEPERAAAFQSELQRLGYAPAEEGLPLVPPTATTATKQAKRPSKATKAKEGDEPPLLGSTPTLELPGIGPATAKRLAKRGVASAEDLLRVACEAYPHSKVRAAVTSFCKTNLAGIVHPANLGRLTRWCERFASEQELSSGS